MIKKLLLFIAFIIASSYLQGQIIKGSVLLGGRLQYVTDNISLANSTEQAKQRYLIVSPAVAFALKENLFFGVELNFGGSTSENANINTTRIQRNKNFGGAVFLRKYLTLGRNFYLFAEGKSGVGFFKEEPINSSQSPYTKGYKIYFSMYPGISYAINRRFHIETGFNDLAFANFTQSRSYGSSSSDSRKNSFSIGTNLNNPNLFSFAFRMLLAK